MKIGYSGGLYIPIGRDSIEGQTLRILPTGALTVLKFEPSTYCIEADMVGVDAEEEVFSAVFEHMVETYFKGDSYDDSK